MDRESSKAMNWYIILLNSLGGENILPFSNIHHFVALILISIGAVFYHLGVVYPACAYRSQHYGRGGALSSDLKRMTCIMEALLLFFGSIVILLNS
jgi:hypothetical protein